MPAQPRKQQRRKRRKMELPPWWLELTWGPIIVLHVGTPDCCAHSHQLTIQLTRSRHRPPAGPSVIGGSQGYQPLTPINHRPSTRPATDVPFLFQAQKVTLQLLLPITLRLAALLPWRAKNGSYQSNLFHQINCLGVSFDGLSEFFR